MLSGPYRAPAEDAPNNPTKAAGPVTRPAVAGRASVTLLSTAAKQRSCKLGGQIARASPVPTAASVRLLPSTEKRSGELADQVSTPRTAVPALLPATSKRVQREALYSLSSKSALCVRRAYPKASGTGPSLSVNASCPLAGLGTLRLLRLDIWARGLRWGAAVRATAHRRLGGGQLPLRNAGADLHI